MRRWRTSREANPEAFDKAGNAAHVHVEFIARAQPREPLRIRRAAGQFCSQLTEIVLEACRRHDFHYPGGRVAGVPERVPLFARFEDQVARIADHDGISEQYPDAALEDEAIFIFAMMTVHGRCERARLHRMFDNGEAFARVVPVNHESGARASEDCKLAIMWAEYFGRRHGAVLSTALACKASCARASAVHGTRPGNPSSWRAGPAAHGACRSRPPRCSRMHPSAARRSRWGY